MSYILEALKKSQTERELGRVPTLEGAGLFAEDQVPPPRSHWALVAVGLAAAAVLIALYAALRQPLPQAAPAAVRADPRGTAAPESTARLAATPPAAAAAASDGMIHPIVSASPPILAPAGAAAVGAPLVEAPPPRGGPREPPAVPVSDVATPGRAAPPPPGPVAADGVDAGLEQELQRQMESDLGSAQAAEQFVEEAQPQEPVPTPVPPDLIADIESFKHHARPGPGQIKPPGKAPVKAPDPESDRLPGQDQGQAPVISLPTAPKPAAPHPAGDPTTLRLTRDQQASLPHFLMSVHVYDPDPPRRFVLINGLKYHEGDKTREGLTVEQILADGAVLGYQGNPFFVHR